MTVMMVRVTMMVAVKLHGDGGQWLALMVLMMMLHLCSLTWQLEALRFAAHAHDGRLTD